jgi:hypothetical protein
MVEKLYGGKGNRSDEDTATRLNAERQKAHCHAANAIAGKIEIKTNG